MNNMILLSINLFGFMIPLQLNQMLFAAKEQHKINSIRRFIVTELIYLACGCIILWTIDAGIITSRNIAMYLLVFTCSFMAVKVNYGTSNIETIFISTCGYALQHMAYSIFAIIWYYIGQSFTGTYTEGLYNIGIQVILLVMVYIIFFRKGQPSGERRERDPIMIALAGAVLFCSVCLSVWCTIEGDDSNETVQILTQVVCKLYAIVSCGLAIGLGHTISHMNMLHKQKEFMGQLIHSQGNQFQLTQESISIINRKCHDIKYQMKFLSTINNSDKRQEYIDELRKAISIYDSVYHTGNEALNLLLREKTLICEEHEIQFSCMAEGEILLFMESDDLYVLLGNALDNAIESVLKESDVQKRVISMNVGLRQGIINIHLENYCQENVEFQNGLPVTTKPDKNYHGFGVQSIQYIAEKYKGNVIMQKIADTFYLDIFFPKDR